MKIPYNTARGGRADIVSDLTEYFHKTSRRKIKKEKRTLKIIKILRIGTEKSEQTMQKQIHSSTVNILRIPIV